MNRQFLKDSFGWGFLLWLFGYIIGIMLFSFIPPSILGWVITPFGTTLTLWVLFKKIKIKTFQDYLLLALIWAIIAIVFDYFFLVKIFKPADGYYKLDVYLYYALTFVLPLIAAWVKKSGMKSE